MPRSQLNLRSPTPHLARQNMSTRLVPQRQLLSDHRINVLFPVEPADEGRFLRCGPTDSISP